MQNILSEEDLDLLVDELVNDENFEKWEKNHLSL